MPVYFLPRPQTCCFKNLKTAAIFIALFGLVEGLLTVLLFIKTCNSLYTAGGSLGIPMLISVTCTSTLGIFLVIGSICFFLQVLFGVQCADNLFIWLLIVVPIFNIVYFILTLLRITVDRVQCVPFDYEVSIPIEVTGSVYIMFASFGIAGLSIYFAFVANAYSCDLENRRQNSMIYHPRRVGNLLPECIRSRLQKLRNETLLKKLSKQHTQELSLYIASTDEILNAENKRRDKAKHFRKKKNEEKTSPEAPSPAIQFHDDYSESS